MDLFQLYTDLIARNHFVPSFLLLHLFNKLELSTISYRNESILSKKNNLYRIKENQALFNEFQQIYTHERRPIKLKTHISLEQFFRCLSYRPQFPIRSVANNEQFFLLLPVPQKRTHLVIPKLKKKKQNLIIFLPSP